MRRLAALALALTLAACGGDDGGDAPRPVDFGGDRPVGLQVPTDFDPSRAYPLLIVLHGYGASGGIQQGYFRLGDAATARQRLILAPEGTLDPGGRQFWNAGPTCCDFGGVGVDDVGYLGGLIDDVRAAYPVARVELIGHSNGAFMAYRMACERADVVATIAGLAGHATTLPCTPSAPVSVLHLHGDADETVPYQTGTFNGVTSPGAVDSITGWATRNGCTGALAAAGMKNVDGGQPGDESIVSAAGGCPAGGAAELWTIPGGTHIPPIDPAFPELVLGWFDANARP